jgi:hypothetical protein
LVLGDGGQTLIEQKHHAEVIRADEECVVNR